jgi:hypothetical protein
MGKFDLKIDKAGAEANVTINGVIDEDADFGPHKLEGVQKVTVYTGGIKSINSCGIREWIKWIGTAGPVNVEYVECPKIIVDQINMVQGFLPKTGKVQSFYVPYYSEALDQEKSVLFTAGKEFNDQGLAEAPVIKDEEGNEMEMDVVEAKYFKFLKKS